MKKNLAIIGGGIVGATAAYYALKEGHTVTLYEDQGGRRHYLSLVHFTP